MISEVVSTLPVIFKRLAHCTQEESKETKRNQIRQKQNQHTNRITITMASKEPFLPVPTEEDPENMMGSMAVPTAATYNPVVPGSHASNTVPAGMSYDPSYRTNNPGSMAGSMSMSFDATATGENGFPDNAINRHTLCCNCCCDFRRAVLIVNGISIGIKLMAMIGVVFFVHYLNDNLEDIENDLDDDNTRKQVDSMFKSGQVAGFEWFFEILETIAIAIHACGIYGALQFKQWGIIVAGSIFALQFVVSFFSMDFGSILISGLMLYPHVCMFNLMKAGIMTPQNYHKVASCCGDRHM